MGQQAYINIYQGRSQDFRRGGARGGGRDLPIGPNSVCFVESSIFTAFV